MIISLAGPIVNIFIVVIASILPNELLISKQTIIYANLLLAIFNLLPIYPLDGGRILKEIVTIQRGREKAYDIINKASKITVILLTFVTSIAILYIHNISFIIILAYLWYLVLKNERMYKFRKRVYEQIREKKT